jgi:hypothetical protein
MFWNLISRVTLATAVMANPAPNTPDALFAVPDPCESFRLMQSTNAFAFVFVPSNG